MLFRTCGPASDAPSVTGCEVVQPRAKCRTRPCLSPCFAPTPWQIEHAALSNTMSEHPRRPGGLYALAAKHPHPYCPSVHPSSAIKLHWERPLPPTSSSPAHPCLAPVQRSRISYFRTQAHYNGRRRGELPRYCVLRPLSHHPVRHLRREAEIAADTVHARDAVY